MCWGKKFSTGTWEMSLLFVGQLIPYRLIGICCSTYILWQWPIGIGVWYKAYQFFSLFHVSSADFIILHWILKEILDISTNCRYIIAKNQDDKPVAYLHYRFNIDFDSAVLYWWAIVYIHFNDDAANHVILLYWCSITTAYLISWIYDIIEMTLCMFHMSLDNTASHFVI